MFKATPKTVDSVLAVFTKTISDLRAVADHQVGVAAAHKDAAEAARARASAAEASREAALAESRRAVEAATKLEQFLA